MNPEKQRMAIAEACGMSAHVWSEPIDDCRIGFDPQCLNCCMFVSEAIGVPFCLVGDIPDYLNDLNAMQAAESFAGMAVIKAMRFYLWEICGQMSAHHATAAQRAKAFLLATGKWEGSE